jgi:NifU-like protein involved in Fe-S cluster formation
MGYSGLVARHFDQPANVGPLTGPGISRGEAGSSSRGAWVVIEAAIGAGVIERLGFRAFGSPYVIAACSRATEILIGAPAVALARFDPAVLAGELEVPAHRLGELLVLQDALRNCWADWDTTQPAGPR